MLLGNTSECGMSSAFLTAAQESGTAQFEGVGVTVVVALLAALAAVELLNLLLEKVGQTGNRWAAVRRAWRSGRRTHRSDGGNSRRGKRR